MLSREEDFVGSRTRHPMGIRLRTGATRGGRILGQEMEIVTDNGAYIIGDRYSFLVMDSSTYGVPVNSPDGYRTEVEWATQMSYSGIYVHSAPWSVGSQGIANVSHGCLNVNPANARWFYGNTRRGDIVEVINTTGPTLSGTDGLGDWNIPWEQWKAGNANL